MHIRLNQTDMEVPSHCSLAQALDLAQLHGPFATALNRCFVPRPNYALTLLSENDHIETIVPITGG